MILKLYFNPSLPANGLPDIAATRRTIFRDRGITARRPPLAAPAPGPKLQYPYHLISHQLNIFLGFDRYTP